MLINDFEAIIQNRPRVDYFIKCTRNECVCSGLRHFILHAVCVFKCQLSVSLSRDIFQVFYKKQKTECGCELSEITSGGTLNAGRILYPFYKRCHLKPCGWLMHFKYGWEITKMGYRLFIMPESHILRNL